VKSRGLYFGMRYILSWPEPDPTWVNPYVKEMPPQMVMLGELTLEVLVLPMPDPLIRLYVAWINYIRDEAELRLSGRLEEDLLRLALDYRVLSIVKAWDNLAEFAECNYSKHPLFRILGSEVWRNFTQHTYRIVFLKVAV
jgi:hypothetical protein